MINYLHNAPSAWSRRSRAIMKKLVTLPGKKISYPQPWGYPLILYRRYQNIYISDILWLITNVLPIHDHIWMLLDFLLRYQTSQMLVSINYCFPWSVLRFQRFWMSVKIKIFVLYRLQDWNILETIVNNNFQINRSAEFLRLWYLLHFLQPMIYIYNSLSSSDISALILLYSRLSVS